MTVVPLVETWIALALAGVALVLEGWAFGHALTQRPDAFVAAGKRTKGFWLAVTGVALLAGLVTIVALGGNPFAMISLVAVVGAGVYLADVRPALAEVLRRSSRGW